MNARVGFGPYDIFGQGYPQRGRRSVNGYDVLFTVVAAVYFGVIFWMWRDARRREKQ